MFLDMGNKRYWKSIEKNNKGEKEKNVWEQNIKTLGIEIEKRRERGRQRHFFKKQDT